MAKYGSGVCIRDVCALEVEEMTEILERYHVSDYDKDILTGMVKEAYFQLKNCADSGRAAEKLLEARGIKLTNDTFYEYMEYYRQAQAENPLKLDDEDNAADYEGVISDMKGGDDE